MPRNEGMNTAIGSSPQGNGSGGDWDPLSELKNGLKVWADVGVTLGKSLDAHTEEIRRYRRLLERNTPVPVDRVASGLYSSGNMLLSLGKPDEGTNWEVHAVIVGGTDPSVSATGSATLYVSAYEASTYTLDAAPLGTGSAVDWADTLPNVGYYGTGQLVVHEHEHLFLVVYGASASQIYAAHMFADAYPTDAAGGRISTVI